MTDVRPTAGRDDETVEKPPSDRGGPPAVLCRGLSHSFGRRESRFAVLRDITLTVRPGEVVLLTGPSGSGKSTLLRLFAGLLPVQEGQLQVLGTDMRGLSPRQRLELRRQIGFIFPGPELIKSLSVAQNVEMGLGHERLSARERRGRVEDVLRQLGLEHRAAYRPHHLSGGQLKRVAIARALVHRPRLVLANEPTAELDVGTAEEVRHMLAALAREIGTAVVLVTYDRRLAETADRVIGLDGGRVVHDGRGQLLPPWA